MIFQFLNHPKRFDPLPFLFRTFPTFDCYFGNRKSLHPELIFRHRVRISMIKVSSFQCKSGQSTLHAYDEDP